MGALHAAQLALTMTENGVVVGGVTIGGTALVLLLRTLVQAGPSIEKAAQDLFRPARASSLTPTPQASAAMRTAWSRPAQAPTAARTPGGSVFISYPRTERPYVGRLAQHLRSEGLEVWFDEQLVHGEGWLKQIEHQLERAAAVVIVMSAQEPSNIFEEEIIYARELDKPVFPISISGASYFGLKGPQREDVNVGQLPSPRFVRGVVAAAGPGA